MKKKKYSYHELNKTFKMRLKLARINLIRIIITAFITYFTSSYITGLFFDERNVSFGFLFSFPLLFMLLFRLRDGEGFILEFMYMIRVFFFALIPGIFAAGVSTFDYFTGLFFYCIGFFLILAIENKHPVKRKKYPYEGRSNAEWKKHQLDNLEYDVRRAESDLDHERMYGSRSSISEAEDRLFQAESDYDSFES